MTDLVERALNFECAGERLIGVLAAPLTSGAAVGVVIVVGGPQYRAGSHRQFVLLARALARAGVSCVRFDYRGMGDAGGDQRSFEQVGEDIRAAVDTLLDECPAVRQVVLWGLCDGASAACLYDPADTRVTAQVLVNPWVRTQVGEARTRLRHYYLKRLVDPAFWRKLLGGGVKLASSARELGRAAAEVKGGSGPSDDLPVRMAQGLLQARRQTAVFLSDRDYVAREFEGVLTRYPHWADITRQSWFEGIRHFEADHTFSTGVASAALEQASAQVVLEWGAQSQGGRAP